MDLDNKILLERYFNTSNSPYEKTNRVSKHLKFVEPDNFEKDLMKLYSESGTSNLPSIYKLISENFNSVELSLSHTERYKHIYRGSSKGYDLEGAQVHFLHPRPRVNLYEDSNLNKWSSLAIFKKGTSTALFRI